jgi:putative endonuclease
MVSLLECADRSLYTGITTNPDRRPAEHAAGKGAKYTTGRGPFWLVSHREICAGRAPAVMERLEASERRLTARAHAPGAVRAAPGRVLAVRACRGAVRPYCTRPTCV